MLKWQGIYTALITPFTSSSTLDEEGLAHNVSLQIEAGVDGIVALGTTAEAPTLSTEEKRQILCIIHSLCQGKLPMIVGTGSNSTAQTIKNTQEAENLGASAAMVVTPYYNKPSQEGIWRHFKAIHDATELPLIIYNTPGRSGQKIELETLLRLADLPRVTGIKESSAKFAPIMEITHAVKLRKLPFSVLTGDDQFVFPTLALGAHGVISVLSNLVPHKFKELKDALAQDDFKKGQLLHHQLMPLFNVMGIDSNPIPIKAAMEMANLAAGPCRLPLCELSKEKSATLQTTLSPWLKEIRT